MVVDITFDLESRSAFDIKNGMHGYAEHPTTDIICFAVKADSCNTRLWVSPPFRHLDEYNLQDLDDEEFKQIVNEAQTIEAHNCGFEYTMWENIMVKRYGFPSLPIDKLRCSAAKAAALALPRSLDGACKAMKVSVQKDAEGKKIMLRLCKPRRPLKKERDEDPEWESKLYWDEDPLKFKKLFEYCKTDVDAEHSLSKSLVPLYFKEQEIWKLDLVINNRGICLDKKSIEYLIGEIEKKEKELDEEAFNLTGRVARTSQRDAALRWLATRKVPIYGYTKDDISNVLEGGVYIEDDVKRFLEIRQALGLTSIAKLKKVVQILCNDGRAKGLFLYAGARTFRWSGKLFQPHNLPRNSFNSFNEVSNFIRSTNISKTEFFKNVTKCIRPMIKAQEGSTFFCGDFSAIESRTLAWLVGDKTILNAYLQGKDIYKINAANIYKVKYEDVTDDQRFVGKVAELSLGYQGGVGAFIGMCDSYGVTDIDVEQAKNIVYSWRSSRSLVKNFWDKLKETAIQSIKTGRPQICGRVKFWMHGAFLRCDLPDGTTLSYPYAKVEEIESSYGESITFWGVASDKDKVLAGDKRWGKIATYGGKLCENIVQSLARKLLAESMLRLEKFGFKTVMHVHDEVVCEVPLKRPKYMTLDLFTEAMQVRPMWCKKLPLEVKAWEGERYRK